VFAGAASALNTNSKERNVIFIHPDGTAQAHYTAARLLHYGPDGTLNWDRLPHVAVYKTHIFDNLQSGSVAGAVAHASGIKTKFNYYGLTPDKKPLRTVLEDARDAGFATGLVNSGTITEPGTGVFVANVESRKDHAEIAKQILASNVDVILGGGEKWFLPKGVKGKHGEGVREDGANLVEQAKAAGYAVVYNREELLRISPNTTTKLLGLFAEHHTFNDKPEKYLYENNLPLYWDYSPTVAEMTDVAIKILSKKSDKGFALMIEEEGTDNFPNKNNAEGMIEAVKRADDSIGVALRFAQNNDNTLVITAADTNAGGPAILTGTLDKMPPGQPLSATDRNGAPVDGVGQLQGNVPGVPFLTPCGFPFAVSWATLSDEGGGIVARAYGLNAELVSGTIDNTDIYRIMHFSLGL
jgi:alkaline phosphatase